jgi:hypothetical protein
MGNSHPRLPDQRSPAVSDLGDCPRNVINHDVVSAFGADLVAEDEEVSFFFCDYGPYGPLSIF